MKVTVVTAFYKGNQYIQKLLESIEANIESCKKCGIEVESIIVNDSPRYSVDIDDSKYSFSIIILQNSINLGIHASRINGIRAAKGEYIILLDQDDVITPNAILSQCERIKNADVCVGNGYQVEGEKKEPIFRNKKYHSLVKENPVFIKYGTPIISPGQCLIKKESFPQAWLENPLKENGADDEILWIMMHLQGKKFVTNSNDVYHHIATGNNASDNFAKMAQSGLEGVPLLEGAGINKKALKQYVRRRLMKVERYNASALKKLWVNIKYMDLSIYVLKIKCLQRRK